MNCDECHEKVLELIEREQTDPEGVRDILERCPECRATFEELKSTLELTAELPLEEPSAAVDEAVMRAATAHANRVVSLERRRFRPIPWAAAAVALLAVSIGVWSIPTDDAPSERLAKPSSAERAVAEEADEPRVSTEARAELATMKDAADAMAAAEGRPTKRRAQKPSPRPTASRVAMNGEAPREATEEARARDRDCAAEAAALEAEDREVTGEQALEVGRCFRDAGDVEQARRWFVRASADPKTRAPARRALRSLPQE